jgi:hypothetical protein
MPGAIPVIFPDKPADHCTDAHIHAHAYGHEKEKQGEHESGPRNNGRGLRIDARNENSVNQHIAELQDKPDKHRRGDFYGDGNDRAVEHARNFFEFSVDNKFLEEEIKSLDKII